MSIEFLKVAASSEQVREVSKVPVGVYVYLTNQLLELIEEAGGPKREELGDAHVEFVKRFSEMIDEKSQNSIEYMALLGMVACSLVMTLDSAVDFLNFQMDLQDFEEGQS